MFQTEKINDLFQYLKEITTSERPKNPFQLSTRMKRTEGTLVALSAFSCAGLFAITLWSNLRPLEAWMTNIFMWFYISTVLLSLAYLVLSSFNSMIFIWRRRKDPFDDFLHTLHHDLSNDSEALRRLVEFEGTLLEYGLIQYSHCWNIFNNRRIIVFGNPLNFRLLPVFVTGLAAIFNPTDKGNDLALVMFGLTGILFLFNFKIAVQGERPQQIINLLKHAIRLKAAEAQNRPASITASLRQQLS